MDRYRDSYGHIYMDSYRVSYIIDTGLVTKIVTGIWHMHAVVIAWPYGLLVVLTLILPP